MGNYLFSVKIGLIVFPLLALFITIPYMIYQYNKYGSIPYLKTFIVYSFVLYLLEAYFMVILPLPKISLVKNSTRELVQLIPFNFISEIGSKTNLNFLSLSSYIKFLKTPVVYQLLFNIFLTVPFGIYLRYYFKRNIKEVIVFSLILSLFFEVTQLTGLYGLYPRAYRLFDVDDLIVNTLGGIIGYYLAPLFTFFLPSKESLDNKAIEDSRKVTIPRKLIATLIDFSLIYLLTFKFIALNTYQDLLLLSIISLLYFIIFTFLFNGYTLGKLIVRIKVVDESDKKARLYQILIRYQMIYMIYFEVYLINHYVNNNISKVLVILVIFLYLSSLKTIIKNKNLIYDRVSKTRHISTK